MPNWPNSLASARDHSRARREDEAGGIITGARIDVSPKQLGYDVGCFIGIILKSAKDYPSALAKLNAWMRSPRRTTPPGTTASLLR
jgi:Lrp/AsnC family transcriptional regulator for asnA, asnC and gidA